MNAINKSHTIKVYDQKRNSDLNKKVHVINQMLMSLSIKGQHRKAFCSTSTSKYDHSSMMSLSEQSIRHSPAL